MRVVTALSLSVSFSVSFGAVGAVGALGLIAFAPSVAHAGQVEEAEYQRLREEMNRMASRNAWSGVEAKFQEMLLLVPRGHEIAAPEWMLGAQAARALGLMGPARDRLGEAVKTQPNPETIALIEEIDRVYGDVSLQVGKGAAVELKPAAMPFVPDQRKSIEVARAQLGETGVFDGLLPKGAYSLGEEQFVVEPGSSPVRVFIEAPPSERQEKMRDFSFAYVGPRVDIGPGYTRGSDPGAAGAPGAFGGVGARLGVGLEVGVNEKFGAYAEVGYQGLSSKVDSYRDELEALDYYPGHQLRLGWFSIGPTYRMGDIWASAGLTIGAGVAQVIDEDAAVDENLLWNTSGPMLTAGGQASVSYGVYDIGSSLTMAVSVLGGLQSDSQRWYPWANLALTLAPKDPRSNP
jgi:hypothetical protein